MPACDANRKALVAQVTNHPASEKAGAAKYGHYLARDAPAFRGFRELLVRASTLAYTARASCELHMHGRVT
jgi:hypothetical protein